MNFRKIIQFAKAALKAAWDNVLLRLRDCCKRKHLSDSVEENPENSEDQNPPIPPPEESAKTKDKSSKDDKEPNPNSSLPIQPEPSEETASPPKQPEKSRTQVPTKDADADAKPEDSKHKSTGQSSQKYPSTAISPEKPKPQSGIETNKATKKRSKPGLDRGKRDKDKPNQLAENNNPEAKPHCRFVCYEDDDGRWTVAVAIEAGQDAQSVRQGDKEITANGGRYILEDIGAKVTVEFKDENSLKSFQLLKEDKFVVFKMRKNWDGEGQKVKTLSNGDYVVLAHKSCERINKELPQEAEQCRYSDFTAHFFSISEDGKRDGFKNCHLPFSPTKRFSLKGQRFPDDSDLGELFGDDAPQLDNEKWRGVSWIVIGRENGGAVLATFHPEEKTLAEVLGDRSGWFFVRIYDDDVNLLHSFDFRRAKGLKNIFVNKQPLEEVPPIVPTKNGHTKTIVQFEGNLTVRPANDSDGICKVSENENTFAVLPHHPNNDKTKWDLGSGEDCVKAEILLPRIWWKFIEEKGKEGDWQDTPIEMEREAFREAKNEEIRIRLPLRISGIVVGFGDLNSTDNQTFQTKLSKDRKTCETEFRLDDFAFDQAIEKPLRNAMDLCVKLKDSDVVFPIVHIPADAPPPADVKPKPSKIEPDIGEGFSRLELERAIEELYQEGEMDAAKAAEEFENFANSLPPPKSADWWIRIRIGDVWCRILVDPRRKSMLAKNVEKLKAFFN